MKKNVFFLLLFISLLSCKKEVQLPSNKEQRVDSTKLDLVEMNKKLLEMEMADIDEYIQKSSSQFLTTASGIRYSINRGGGQDTIYRHESVKVSYVIKLLNDSLCYDYSGKNSDLLIVGKMRHERGFDEALTLMCRGDNGIFIIPSYLAYGALGDHKKIPPRATLVYQIFSVE